MATEAAESPEQSPLTGSHSVQLPSQVYILRIWVLIIYSVFRLHASLLNS